MAATATRDLTAVDFGQAVKGNDHVLVYFWAPNCAPCEVFAPNYETSAASCPDIVHGKVNFETEKELVQAVGVKLLPTLMAFKNGRLVFKQAGIANPAVMADLVSQLRAHRTSTPRLL